MGFITSDRTQQHIFGYSLDDFVEEKSKCRYIVEIVDELDLSELYSNYSNQGAESYDPKIILGIWFLAYSEGEASSRKIEELCKKHFDFIYISGNLKPDYSTLCRFMQRNSHLWPKYFLQIVEMAKKKKLSEFKEIMVDGTKLRARSSKKQSMRERKLDRYLQGVKEDIKKYKEEVQSTENKEANEENQKRIQKLENKAEQLEGRKKELQERKEKLSPKDRENHQINIIEKDAFMMDLGSGNGYAPAYNGQIAVDAETQFIVAHDLVQDRNDQKQFSEMHKKSESNLGEDKQRVYGADSGYHSLEQVENTQTNNIDAYIGDPKYKNYKEKTFEELKNSEQKISRVDFKYDPETDVYVCPAGQKLEFITETVGGNNKGRKYICKNCSGCALMEKCLEKRNQKKARTLFRDYREVYAEEMRKKMDTEQGKEILMKRQTSVEPTFGNIKENLGFRRFRVRGLKNVKNEFALMCIAHNINKLFKLIFYLKLLPFNRRLSRRFICLGFYSCEKIFLYTNNGISFCY